MKINKRCGKCDITYLRLPKKHKHFKSGDDFEGYYFDCSCGSSLFVQKKRLITKIKQFLKGGKNEK